MQERIARYVGASSSVSERSRHLVESLYLVRLSTDERG